MASVLQVFCRNGLQIAEPRVSKPRNTAKIGVWEPPYSPLRKICRFGVSKMALKPENGAFLAKSRPRNAGFEQKCSKMLSILQDFCINGLHSAERRGSKPPNTTNKGVWRRLKSVNRLGPTPLYVWFFWGFWGSFRGNLFPYDLVVLKMDPSVGP